MVVQKEEQNEMLVMAVPYPYLPAGRTIVYAAASNPFMQAAREMALSHSLDDALKTGAVLVSDGVIFGRGANGSDYHKTHICERVRLNMPTGTGYEHCEGCHPKNHAEPRAIADAVAHGHDPRGSTLYLWGHWWCCKDCWSAMIDAGIENVVLLVGSEVYFNKLRENEHKLGKWHEVP